MVKLENPVNPDNNDATLLDTKDRLLGMLAEARDEDGRIDKIAYCDQAEKVLFVLDTTQGMFNELGYSYKGKEIAQLIAGQCFESLGHCAHAMTIKRVEITRQRALMLVQRFHVLQEARRSVIDG